MQRKNICKATIGRLGKYVQQITQTHPAVYRGIQRF